MQRSAVRLIVLGALLAESLAGCGAPDDEALVVTDSTIVSTVEGSLPLLPPDTAFQLNDGPPVTREEPPPASVPGPAEPERTCDPNYEPCVPVDSDVDCAGGRGNGPSYVKGPVRVIGRDVYGLDRDRDGIGCDR